MAKESLAVRYRPRAFEDLTEQTEIVKILTNQINDGTFRRTALFCGPAGCGKTTSARIFARMINGGKGNPIEIDAASNNGVDNVREVITLANQKALDAEYKVFIMDECFPKGTRIKTDKGELNIEDIVVGTNVQDMTGFNKVTYVFNNRVFTKNLCCVILNDRKVVTTKNHLFFTNNGWVAAQDLKKGDKVYASTCVSKLWKDFYECKEGCEVLLSPMFSGISKEELCSELKSGEMYDLWERISSKNFITEENLFKGMHQQTNIHIGIKNNEIRITDGKLETILRKDEETQSNVSKRNSSENVGCTREEWNSSQMDGDKGWKWEIHNTTSSAMERIREWLGIGISNKNRDEFESRNISYKLQSRPCFTRNETCDRGRWQRTLIERFLIEGLEEDREVKTTWVESVEVYERGNNEQLFRDYFTDTELHQEYVTMYDLEVENDHTYFANDILVHNCHMLSIGAWNAVLKLFEEPPLKSVFILCTTDPQKIPATILSRVQRFDFQRISNKGIVNRLKYIVDQEGLQNRINEDALEFIARMASGGMRDSITMLDKCLSLGDKLDIEQVSKILNSTNYDIMFELLNNIIDCKMEKVIDIIEKVYQEGVDLKLFIKRLSTLILDIRKYQLFKNFDYIQVPKSYEEQLKSMLGVDYEFCNYLLNEINTLSNDLKYEQNTKALVEIKLMLLSKEE